MSDFFFEYRNVLQGKPVRDLLKAGLKSGDSSAFSAIADMARQKVYGAFTIADLSHLEDDPFLLGAESFDYFTLHSQLMGGRFTLRRRRFLGVVRDVECRTFSDGFDDGLRRTCARSPRPCAGFASPSS